MKLRYRILGGLAVVAILGLASAAVVISRDAPCGGVPALPEGAVPMKAVVARCYGPPNVLAIQEVARPAPAAGEILVRVRAAALNPLDWHYMRGTPYVMRMGIGIGLPDDVRVGVDFAGTIEAVGAGVTRFKPGDAVFGGKSGALAEYLAVRAERVVLKPDNVTFEQAAAVPIAGVTALQGLRDHVHVHAGQKLLINGASGGVGTFAVQIAKAYGADVTAVCSTRNVELVRSLGADHVIDYTQQDFTQGAKRYDAVFDMVGNRSPRIVRRVLTPEGIYLGIGGGGPDEDPWIGAFLGMIKARVLSPFVSQTMGTFLADITPSDLEVLAGLMRDGKVTPVIDRRYALGQARDAMMHLEEGHTRGKIVIGMGSEVPGI